jgi:hypothetical protein
VVDHERDRLELVGYRIDSIPTERARSLPDREMEGAPNVTRAEIAHQINMGPSRPRPTPGYAEANNSNGVR